MVRCIEIIHEFETSYFIKSRVLNLHRLFYFLVFKYNYLEKNLKKKSFYVSFHIENNISFIVACSITIISFIINTMKNTAA